MIDAGNIFLNFNSFYLDTPNIQSKTMTSIPLHLISNISKSSSLSDDSGEIIIPYIPPHPTRGTGFHRYIHVLFSHSKPSNTSLLKANLEKYKWDVKKFFHSEEFDSLNWNPRAMAFHRASWSPIVSEIYERGLVKIPANLRVDGKNENQAINDGWLNVKDEPIFGLPVKRSWKSVNRRLYRYAFK